VSWTEELVDSLAQHLENRDVGTFNSSGVPYAAGATAITIDGVPSAPDKVITLTLYDAAEDPTQGEAVAYVQARVRGDRDPRTAMRLTDAVFDAWQNLPRSPIGGQTVAGIWRDSAAYMGPDDNGRHMRTSNYRIRVTHPSPHRV
jgi:hypothetical protein